MGEKRMDPKQQFSKKLAMWTAAFWFFYMTWLSSLFIVVPSAAMYAVYMAIIATFVMIINVYSYCKNSIAEKTLLTLLDKTKLELTLSNKGKKTDDSEEDTQQEGDDG